MKAISGHLLSLVLKGEVEEEIVFFLLPDAFMSACETPGYLADRSEPCSGRQRGQGRVTVSVSQSACS